MLFMNEWEIQEAVERHARHPVLKIATRVLYDLMTATNQVSDGWAYWPKPCRASRKLQELIRRGNDARHSSLPTTPITEKDLRATLSPIRAMLTRNAKTFSGHTIQLPD